MLLVDAIFVNQGGGKTLLDYLIQSLENEKIEVHFLLDSRLKDEYKNTPNSTFLKASYIQRHQYYQKNKHQFSKVFCFGNQPPSLKLDVPVYTYLQNVFYVDKIPNHSYFYKFKYFLRKKLFQLTLQNSDEIWVQTNLMKSKFINSYNFNKNNVKIYPFFNPIPFSATNTTHKKIEFMCLSDGKEHKNILYILNTWKELYKKGYSPTLHLTISNEFEYLNRQINELQQNKLNIINHGRIDPKLLFEHCQFQIYASLNESFGLSLIESVLNSTDIICVDLPYVHEIVLPSYTFNPSNSKFLEDIVIELETNKNINFPKSELKIENAIQQIMLEFKNS